MKGGVKPIAPFALAAANILPSSYASGLFLFPLTPTSLQRSKANGNCTEIELNGSQSGTG